jgi:DNA-binding response OmpR family regulator
VSEETYRILVVEDEDNLRELVSGRLASQGYEVEVACDGYEALAKFRSFHPHLVVLDLMLPKMDGYAVCRVLKSGGRDNTVPVILFSARFSPEDRLRGEEMGADAFVNKPFDPPVLLGKIHELLHPEEPIPEAAAEEGAPAPAEPAPAAPAPAAVKAPAPGEETEEEEESPREQRPPTKQELAERVRPRAPAPAPAAGNQPEERLAGTTETREGFFQKLLRILFKKV